jgi:hypothetical protein
MRTRIEHVEVDPPISASGSLDDPEPHWSALDAANSLYTIDWTLIETPADADELVERLLEGASDNELRYIANVYFRRDNRETAKAILRDKIDELESYLTGIEAERADELATYRASLGPDSGDTWWAHVGLGHVVDMVSRLKEQLAAEDAPVAASLARRIAATGGAGIDPRTQKVVDYADSVHDFNPDPPAKGRVVVPQADIKASMGVVLPDGLTDAMVANKFEFVSFMVSKETLIYEGEEVPNDALFGKDILYQFDINASYLAEPAADLWELFRRQQLIGASGLLESVDVWCPSHREKREPMPREGDTDREYRLRARKVKLYKNIVYMAQITTLIARIKDYFGDGRLTFIVDASDDQMTRMIMATSELDPAIGRRFAVYADVGGQKLDTTGKKIPRPMWTYAICDANLLDGQTHIQDYDYDAPKLSRRKTGIVMDRSPAEQTELMGIHGPDEDPYTEYRIGEASRVKNSHKDAPFSQTIMATEMNTLLRVGIKDINTQLASKLTCDRGQAMHCQEYDEPDNRHILVTSDVLATLFAAQNGINFISLNRCTDDILVPEPMAFLQCTFTFGGRALSALEGGAASSSRNVVLSVVLAAVVALSFIA